MKTGEMILVTEFCTRHHIELSFIHSLQESGLIEITKEDETLFIPENQLPNLEKIVHLYEMDINLEGIEAITHLLDRLQKQQERINMLINRLRYYAPEEEIGEIE